MISGKIVGNGNSLVPRPLPPEERPGTHCSCMRVISQDFSGFIK